MIRLLLPLCLLMLVLIGTGCAPGSILARQLVKAPNRQPKWAAPPAKVTLSYHVDAAAARFSLHRATVGDPAVRLDAGVIEPGDYGFRASGRWEKDGARPVFRFRMHLAIPTNQVAPPPPRGTVFLLHGYGLNKEVMLPWGFYLAQTGYRCVLVDLRGHGGSGGDRIWFGAREADDLRELLNELTRREVATGPVAVLGNSYGAVIALRWAAADPRVRTFVAMAPYARLADAMEGLRQSYAGWVPRGWVRQAALRMPRLLGVPSGSLDTDTVLAEHPVEALLVAGGRDVVAREEDLERLRRLVSPDSTLLILPEAGHEELPYEFDALALPVKDWLDRRLLPTQRRL